MFDRELVLEILASVHASLELVQKRFRDIRSADDFVKDDLGLEKLDSICMQLIATGEALKQIDKLTGGTLFPRFEEVDWKKAMGMRDFIAHHYYDIDHEVVFNVCRDRIPGMKKAIVRILEEVRKEVGW
jgi:uncharacterized protein with HEPN domain